MTQKLVVVHTASSMMETALLKSRLEAEGIPVLVSQEGAAQAYGFSIGPIARADILVPEDRAEEAKAVVAEVLRDEGGNTKAQDSNPNS